MDAIRDKDEKYWDDYKGTPKAFVSSGKALEMWSNRFGNYTAVRYPANSFDERKYNEIFAQQIHPGDLGMAIEPVREQGIHAAENGTDTAYASRGLGDWIDSAGPSDVPSGFRTPADSIHATDEGAFTETVLNNIITSIFRVTGTTNNLTMVADTAVRRIISDFARTAGVSGTDADSVRTVNYNGESAQIKLSVEFYQSDHGMITIVNGNPDCMPDTTNKDYAYLLNPEYYGVHELIPMGSTRLPNQGGGERGYVDCALTIGVYPPGAHGKIEEVA